MLKLFICSTVFTPVLLLAGTGLNSQGLENYELEPTVSATEIAENCTAQDMDVYFHDQWIEMHSADHIRETLAASHDCADRQITLSILSHATVSDEVHAWEAPRLAETEAYLQALDVKYDVAQAPTRLDVGTPLLNDAAVRLSISFEPVRTAGLIIRDEDAPNAQY